MVIVQERSKAKKFSSIKEAAKASGIPYMTLYMRMRKDTGGLCWSVSKAMKKPVRKYEKREG